MVKIRAAGIRCSIDSRNEKLGYMIREAQYKERVPYMVIIGEKEKNENKVSVRFRDKEGTGIYELNELIERSADSIACSAVALASSNAFICILVRR